MIIRLNEMAIGIGGENLPYNNIGKVTYVGRQFSKACREFSDVFCTEIDRCINESLIYDYDCDIIFNGNKGNSGCRIIGVDCKTLSELLIEFITKEYQKGLGGVYGEFVSAYIINNSSIIDQRLFNSVDFVIIAKSFVDSISRHSMIQNFEINFEDEFYDYDNIVYGMETKKSNNVFESKLLNNQVIRFNPFVTAKMVRKGLFVSIGGNKI